MKLLLLAIILFSFNSYSLEPLTEVIPGKNFYKGIDPAPTPLLVNKQVYLGPGPLGLGTDVAWSIPGGKGENVRIIDIETGMNPDHEDLPALFFSNIPRDRHHGTAVMGILAALDNGIGLTGIAHKASFGFAGFSEGASDISDHYIEGITEQIRQAVKVLNEGDILIIEQQATGPKGDLILVEYWDEIFAELKTATEKGIICVAAAGNGNSDLDHSIYANKFNRSKRDSGCIIVGAGKIGSNEKIYASNYGTMVDTFGYGDSVTTTGYGDLFYGGWDASYTEKFSGTSSATPIVAGAIALVSSIAKERRKTITSKEMREALRNTGIKQEGDTSKRIGNFPQIGDLLKYFSL